MRVDMRAGSALIFALLLTVSFVGAGAASAQISNWVSVVSVRDMTGGQTLTSTAPLVAGHTYNTTIRIDVPVGTTGATFRVALNQKVDANGSQFWYLKTPGYAGYNRSTFTSSLRTVQFNWIQGSLVLSAIYKIPLNLTTITTNGVVLHLTQGAFNLVQVTVSGGSAGGVTATVEDQSIETYLNEYHTASNLISSGQVSSSYSSLMSGILNLSQNMYKAGLTDQGTALLEDVTPSVLPTPPSSSNYLYLLVAVIVIAVVAALFAVGYIRGRSKTGYASAVINETNRELASLEVVASRYDKTLADQLKKLRDKLTEAS